MRMCATRSFSSSQSTLLMLTVSHLARRFQAGQPPPCPPLGLTSYHASSADHAPIPTTFATIGVDWQSDPLGQLYLAATTRHFSPWPGHRLTVAGWPATSYAHWTAPPAQGGIYVEHVYFFVPWYQRDYDLWLQAA